MVFMVLEELLPEAYDRASRAPVAVVVSLTLVGMMLFQRML
jgi:zinc transporter ZupT